MRSRKEILVFLEIEENTFLLGGIRTAGFRLSPRCRRTSFETFFLYIYFYFHFKFNR